jgi:hypothetical protein
MRRRLGITQAQGTIRMGITQGAYPPSSTPGRHLRTAHPGRAYAEAPGGRLEIVADFGDQRLAFTEPGAAAA